jgi:diguanylate cyclase (GGDEF)-like protein
VKVANGDAPAAGYEKAQPGANRELDFLASIIAARYEAQALLEFSNDLGRSLSLDETLSVVAARLRKLVPYDAVAIYRLQAETLAAEYVTGDDYRTLASLKIPLGEGLSGWVAENRKPILNGNPAVEPGYVGSLRSALAVPLLGANDRMLGVLTLYQGEADAFANDHLRILLAISDKIGASMENAAKYQNATDSATVDYLTGLPNARSLFWQLDSEISRCQREHGRLAVVLCDLDGFKQINDQFGHMLGNQVLEAFAHKLKLACREYDYVSRMGGDEFVVIAPGLQRSDAVKIYARIKAAAAAVKGIGPGIRLSASVGIAFYPEDSTQAAQLLMQADKRMYTMKKDHHFAGPQLAIPSHIVVTQ